MRAFRIWQGFLTCVYTVAQLWERDFEVYLIPLWVYTLGHKATLQVSSWV